MPAFVAKPLIITATLTLLTALPLQAETILSCPDKPNCVSSQEQGDHFIAPLGEAVRKEGATSEELKNKLVSVLQSWPGTEIITSTSNTIEAVITSRWMGFEDDLILKIRDDGRVDVRSSSRSGYFDFGVNRKRVEQLRAAIQASGL